MNVPSCFDDNKSKIEIPLQSKFQIFSVNETDLNGNPISVVYVLIRVDSSQFRESNILEPRWKKHFSEVPSGKDEFIQITILSMERAKEIISTSSKINPSLENLDITRFLPGENVVIPQKIYNLLSYGFNPTIYINKNDRYFFIPQENTGNKDNIAKILNACELFCIANKMPMMPIVVPSLNRKYIFDPENRQYLIYNAETNAYLNTLPYPNSLLFANSSYHTPQIGIN